MRTTTNPQLQAPSGLAKGRSGVYQIRNVVSGGVYIGSSQDIPRRWRKHREALRRGAHGNSRLQRAWDKYGENAFVFEVLLACPPNNLLTQEQMYIDSGMCGQCYNLAPIAGAPMRGRKHSAATRAAMSAAKRLPRGPLSEEHKEILRRKAKLRTHTPETRAKISAALRRRGQKATHDAA